MDIINITEEQEFNTSEIIKKVPLLTESAIVSLMFLEKGQEMCLHKHPTCEEFIYVVDGNCEITIGNETKKLKSKNIVLVPRSVLHRIKNCPDKKLILLIFTSIECKNWEE